jgi:hypothetical protein
MAVVGAAEETTIPSKITNFLHDSFVTAAPAPVLGTAFSTSDVHLHNMAATLPPFQKAGNFSGIVEGIHVRVTNIAGGGANITIKVCLDATGDVAIVPETTAPLTLGTTTATDGCAAFAVRIPIFQILTGTTLYLFAHLDAGTADYSNSCITWRE